MEKSTFFKLYYPGAVLCERETQIPALATLAQAAIESSWGEKAPGNNFFGIKADKSWKGKRQTLRTREVFSDNDRKKHIFPDVHSVTQFKDDKGKVKYEWIVNDYFRAYDTVAEGFSDHGKFFHDNPRYAMALQAKTPYEFADAVAAAGYATGPGYAKLWKDVMSGLKEFLPGQKK
ncbi:glycoside hydrolase family 73 protein [Chitinophaga sancti]|uniref:Flagellar protein FlgJ n=1 Tax=Chitinophaga sancti TaxID=1004 RepID=A0A1K1LY12_9BACT|nr:glucosaminidase domain-containing protein [Chitinophaga sancti]WQD64760.1 glucosaminidase domain-containing protein [Chitinophaga sancti]WQG89618.1 glucosaminidase domain-containing protein [Chitinophaga sancti]SFW15738.1 flagellar protein FlgJ [Chitinophaga sancti]